MEKLTITQIYREVKPSKKTGKPYESVRIKTNEHGDKYISGFGRTDNKDWKVGDVVEVDVVQKGEYLNFEMPKKVEQPKEAAYSADMNAVMVKLNFMHNDIKMIKHRIGIGEKTEPIGEIAEDTREVPDGAYAGVNAEDEESQIPF